MYVPAVRADLVPQTIGQPKHDQAQYMNALVSALRNSGSGTGAMGLGTAQGSPAAYSQGVQSTALPGILPGASVPYQGMTGGGIFSGFGGG